MVCQLPHEPVLDQVQEMPKAGDGHRRQSARRGVARTVFLLHGNAVPHPFTAHLQMKLIRILGVQRPLLRRTVLSPPGRR